MLFLLPGKGKPFLHLKKMISIFRILPRYEHYNMLRYIACFICMILAIK